jgi:molecular chaperone GrpE
MMIEENKSLEETLAANGDENLGGENLGSENQPSASAEGVADSVDAATDQSIPELLVDEASTDAAAILADELSEAESGQPSESADETDYEAAFLELRSTYAAKERECEALKAQTEDRQGQYLRLAADFENFRRRTQKEKEELEVQIKCTTLSELLSVVDNFERARSQLKPSTDGEMNLHKSYQSVYKDLVDRFKKLGVSPMRAEGQPFDPNLHDAVMREPTKDHPEGTVVEELVRGYVMGEKVLRHAMVKVAAPPEDDEPNAADTTESAS